MTDGSKLIEVVDLDQVNKSVYKRQFASAIVLTKERKILLQQRDLDRSFPGCVSTFGGNIELGEEPMQALIRELNEELGAQVNMEDVVSFGAVTEDITNHTEIIYVYFWHDHAGTITGCYEGTPLYFDNIASVMEYPKVMDYVLWLLEKSRSHGLL
jgi:8-oxo-dGTP diphosphatase